MSNSKIRIALDAMGGDHAPEPIVRGALDALKAHEALEVILVGQEDLIRASLGDQIDNPRISIHHCTEVVGMHEKPTAVRSKKDNSISKCWELMAARQVSAVVSAGNTGAVTAAGLFTKLFLKHVKRPGIAVLAPTAKGPCVLLDVGANANCKPEHLYQYGVMGSVYARKILKKESPTIGLMNIGTEDGKGNDLVRETRQLFLGSQLKDRFHGNIEGRDLYQGTTDVVVCDGFLGNVVLKVSEGMMEHVLKMAAKEIIAALDTEKEIAASAFQALADKYHHSNFGGAPLLGIDGTCIICHGSSDARSICNALLLAAQYDETHLNELIVSELSNQPTLAIPE